LLSFGAESFVFLFAIQKFNDNPLLLLFKALLHGQKDCFFFQRAFNLHTTIRALKSVQAGTGHLNPERFGALWMANGSNTQSYNFACCIWV
jgi:hypothetical protein